MLAIIPTQIEKCKGAMLATAIGDALGWPNEPRSKNRAKKLKVVDHFVEWTRSSKIPRWHDEKILPGEYSDDTQMTLSVARSIIAGDWEKFFAEQELPFWLNYERGGGGALHKAAKSLSKHKVQLWQSHYTRDYFNAGGNGATMRILPHVISAAKTPNITALMENVIKNTLITHGHPRAFLGATCYAYALDYLLRKDTLLEYGELVNAIIDGEKDWGATLNPDIFWRWLEIAGQHRDYNFSLEWENTRIHMLQQLEFIRVALKKGLILDDTKVLTTLECFGKVNGAGDVAALAAGYLASRYANNPPLGIKVPAFLFGADTDTISSITGGLIGMLSGVHWIPPEWKSVQDYDCLIQITELLLSDDKKAATKAGVAEAKAQESGWQTTPIGKMRIVDSKSVSNGKNGFVIIKKWQTVLGQTLYTKIFQPTENKSQQRRQDNAQICPDMLQPQNAISEPKTQPTVIKKVIVVETQRDQIETQPYERQFTLHANMINTLRGKPEFKGNITIGKVLNIIQAFIEKDEPVTDVAKRFDLDEDMVILIKMCVK